jgi:hypothetical protein
MVLQWIVALQLIYGILAAAHNSVDGRACHSSHTFDFATGERCQLEQGSASDNVAGHNPQLFEDRPKETLHKATASANLISYFNTPACQAHRRKTTVHDIDLVS